jgi:hypothetical protein
MFTMIPPETESGGRPCDNGMTPRPFLPYNGGQGRKGSPGLHDREER